MQGGSVRDRLLGGPRERQPETGERALQHHLSYELDRLSLTTTELEKSSTTIRSVLSANQSLRFRIAAAGDALGLFRRRVERDQRFVLAAFWLMCAIAFLVVGRRIGFVWLLKRLATTVSSAWTEEGERDEEL